MTPEEAAANLQRRAQEIRLKAAQNTVQQLLKKFPDSALAVLDHLRSLGIDENTPASSAVAPPSKFTEAIRARDQKRAASLRAMHPSLSAADDLEIPREDLIPTKYWTLGALSVKLISSELLSVLEPGVFSTSNVRSMSLKLKDLGTKEILKQLVTHATGLEDDFPLSGRFRQWSVLAAHMQELNLSRGRRCQDMNLPPTYPRDGIFTLNVTEEAVSVVLKRRGIVRNVPDSRVPQGVNLLRDAHIMFNWSEAKAKIYFDRDGPRNKET